MKKWTLAAQLLVISLASSTTTAMAGDISVSIRNARNDAGVIRCGLFASADGFRIPGQELREAVGSIRNGRASCTFRSVPDGIYAIAVFHAEKGERILETGLFGQPKQGVGFSRNPSFAFAPPTFSSASFEVGPKALNLQVNLKY